MRHRLADSWGSFGDLQIDAQTFQDVLASLNVVVDAPSHCRRTTRRVVMPEDIMAVCQLVDSADGAEQFRVKINDLSRTGLGLVMPRSVRPGVRAAVYFLIGDDSALCVTGRVIWSKAESASAFQTGIGFDREIAEFRVVDRRSAG